MKRMSVKESGKFVNIRKYLVLRLAHQDHRRVLHHVPHDLLHLIRKCKKAREIKK